jgi:HK97 family phage prohead protease
MRIRTATSSSPAPLQQSIAERKATNRPLPMHVMHRILGGDGLPVGVWKSISEDSHGLKVEGKISGMNTDTGRLLFERVKDGALGGLSIGYRVKPNGATFGKGKDEPKRTLHNLDLREISLVDEPSNALSRVDELKSAVLDELKETLKTVNIDAASKSLAAAMQLHAETLTGQNSPTLEQRTAFLTHLQDAHEAVTGQRHPPGMKAMPTTLREFEAWLRESFKLSHAQARSIAENGFKSSQPRDEAGDLANQSTAFLQALAKA